jgi:hypothetical protein
MPTAAAKRKSNEIIEALSSLSFDDPNLQLSLMRIKREAGAVLRAEPAAYYSILGAIACLEKNLPAMHKNHLNSIKISPADYRYLAHLNYASSLSRVGLFPSAYEHSVAAFKECPTDVMVLNWLIDRSIFTGRISEAYHYLKTNSLDGKHPRAKDIVFIESILRDANIHDDDIRPECERVFELLNEQAFCEWGFAWNVGERGASGILTYIFSIKNPRLNANEIQTFVDEKIQNTKLNELVSFVILDNSVIDFLKEFPSDFELLKNVRYQIRRYFPGASTKVEIENDPEIMDRSQLITYIETTLSPEEAIDRLDRLACDWWLDAKKDSAGKIAIDLVFK